MKDSSSSSASKHPSMGLAMDIHRLTMMHTGQLSATPLDELSQRVLTTVLGNRPVGDAIREEEGKIQQLMEGHIMDDSIHENGPLLNGTLYQHLTVTLSPSVSFPPLSSMDMEALEAHQKRMMAQLTTRIDKAVEEMGDMEVLSAKLTLARYTAKCRSKLEALTAYDMVLESPKLSLGKKLDCHLEKARVASFWGDTQSVVDILANASKILETSKGGDWDRRNRLKAYRALSLLQIRELKEASALLVDGIATFASPELCEYAEFVTYAVVMAVLYLPRVDLKKTIIDGSDVLTVAKDIPLVVQLANTLYDCDYKSFLHTLVDLQPHLIANRYLQPHAGFILRELHILAYRQFLDSYQSVTIESMSDSFGVSPSFLDLQLSRFIAAGRLTAKIDHVGGIVETMKTDWKNARYREMIVKGDLLLNRIQKLGRVVDL